MVIPLRNLVIGGGGGYMSTCFIRPRTMCSKLWQLANTVTLDLAVLYLKRASSLADPAISDLK